MVLVLADMHTFAGLDIPKGKDNSNTFVTFYVQFLKTSKVDKKYIF